MRGKRQSRAAQDFAVSDFSLTLVMQIKTSKIINDMAKVQQKSEKITPFGGIFHVRELFSRFEDHGVGSLRGKASKLERY